jgi:prefoldin subunit 5
MKKYILLVGASYYEFNTAEAAEKFMEKRQDNSWSDARLFEAELVKKWKRKKEKLEESF